MKRPFGLLAVGISAFLVAYLAMVAFTWPVGATSRYSAFDNAALGDCDFASVANLVQHEFPGAHITTPSVVRAWRVSGTDGLDYLETTGFDGYRIASYAAADTRAAFIAGANAGGLQASILAGMHAVAVVHAGNSGVQFIDYGHLEFDTWSQWRSDEKGQPLNAEAVTWAPAHTTAIEFSGSYETIQDQTQAEPTGAILPIENPGIVNDGYTFDGWRVNDTGPLLQTGSLWDFDRGAVLYAVWTRL